MHFVVRVYEYWSFHTQLTGGKFDTIIENNLNHLINWKM